MKKFFVAFFSLALSALIIYLGALYVFMKTPNHITDVDELKFLVSDFSDIPIESCDSWWQAEAFFLGGVLESSISGKIIITEEYYQHLIFSFNWRKENSMPIDLIDEKLSEDFTAFLRNKEYWVSDDYQTTMYPRIFLSKNERAIYFYYYDY